MPRIVRNFYRYCENFLDENDLDAILTIISECHEEKLETTCMQNRYNFKLADTLISNILQKYTDKIRNITKNQYIYLANNFPIEYRKYTIGSFMKKHRDTMVYQIPQYECILTLYNSSDSHTIINDWIKISTKKNSLLIVKANGVLHEVSPVQYGERKILKFIFTSTDQFHPHFIYCNK